ncbi:transcription termination factor Rho [Candidatus Gottesmanbacteria bacterium RIFCSPHIGHO2_02_FULL_39_11]|uniref:Transcription termination factor Rho n=1 Tax=Candidatus Gottesmanbacteria bacterium RIFCSPHIGHO2_02_FULL_39_11 TaxID=1798382 RepID=A0A1F5ZXD5_9BACT|nr:MAG: transcription termination factor Rho [Candidatus Gottesmanbacteria bacterium RIFCSPHIGHO2_02_FULL_39_11]
MPVRLKSSTPKIISVPSSSITVDDLVGGGPVSTPTPVVPPPHITSNVISGPAAIPPNNLSATPPPRFNSRPFIPGIISSSHMPERVMDAPTKQVIGCLDIMSEGHGFLRPKFIAGEGDVYISQSQIRKFMLREGDMVEGLARLPKDNERYLGLLKVEKVNTIPAEESSTRPHFEDLTPIYPDKHLKLETEKTPLSTRIIDLVSPIGFGQRGLIVSPPKAGKTTILKEIAHGISVNYPKSHLMAVLIGERPEEVTDIERSVKGEVIASNFDEAPEAQTKVAEVALERAKRMLELGKDVIILLDSITRLARAYNLSVNPSGRTLSGGFDPAALYPAKKFLGAARNCEGGGSLTILGTALVETGSRMDDLIYEEFKGTGNMELHLSRFLQEQRVFPAIDIDKSGTRKEELLLDGETLKKIVTLRHMLSMLGEGVERTSTLIDRLLKSDSNKEFLETLSKG